MKALFESIVGFAAMLLVVAVYALLAAPWFVSLVYNAKHENYFAIIMFDLILSPLGWLHGLALILF